ncbi:MAG: type II secretion system F family protein [Candidatus Bathyarchaeota archaeon]|nr:type II secretion system F family protein [Candidatus Bathyarchaeota archaeon]
MTFLSKYQTLSFRLFGRFAPYLLTKVFSSTKGALERGRVRIYPETYISMMLFTALLSVPVSVAAAAIAVVSGVLPLLILTMLPLFVVAGFMVVPLNNASDRSIGLERELPFAAAYISIMSSGGIAPYDSFKRLTEINLMPAMSREARDVVKDVEIFGVDPLSALETAAKKTPLDLFKDFLGGYASTVIIGGDIGHFLERKAEDIFKARALRVKAAAERLGMLLETFIIVEVMMSLCFYILFAVNNLQTGTTATVASSSDLSQYSGMLLYTFIFTPMLSAMFIYLAHSMQTKTPLTDMRPYKVLAFSSVIAIFTFALLTNLFGAAQLPVITQLQAIGMDLPVATAVSMFICAAPPAIVHIKLSKTRSSMEQGVASFLRDLTEVRKTGLSPEKCIESLSRRDYGSFSKELRKISSDISWGVPIKKVLNDFLHRTRSWLVQIVMFLLVETIDVGGGTIAMIDSLARFNNMTQEVEKEKKMSVRPYVMMPYLASILLVATTVMMMGLTTGISVPGVEAAGPDPLMETIFITSVIFHSFLIGVVAGKISDDSVASGLKHAAILVIIAVVAAKLIPQFIHLT